MEIHSDLILYLAMIATAVLGYAFGWSTGYKLGHGLGYRRGKSVGNASK